MSSRAQSCVSRILAVSFCAMLAACSGAGGGDSGNDDGPPSTIQGVVFDGYIANALVCLDTNRNGRCDGGEPQARSDAAGAFALAIPLGSRAPLVAEITAGQSRDADEPGGVVSASYRMASPSAEYSTAINPFTTLVLVARESDYALAEDLVRNELALPAGLNFASTSPPTAGSTAAGAAHGIVSALKAADKTLDLYSGASLAQVIAALPATLTTLPTFVISTKDAAPIDSREVYRDATFALTNPAISSTAFALNGKVRGRGHETWTLPKKPYKVQFANDAAYAALPDVLGMKKNRNWALLADYLDRSLIRNKLTYSLGTSSAFRDGLKWSPTCQHVEVVVNGEYEGVYLFCEDIRLAPERLNLYKMSTDAAKGEITGGFIFEIDQKLDCYYSDTINLQHVTPGGTSICINTPDETAITLAQQTYAKAYVDAVEADIYGAMRLDKMNTVSFADWYLVEELVHNPDGTFFSSDYMWKDADSAADPKDRLLNMGPLWDHDHAIGNTVEFNLWSPEGCWITKGRPYDYNWYRKIFDSPAFAKLVTDRWKAKRPALQRLVDAGVDAYARRLREAQARNFSRWQILGLPLASYYYYPTWEQEVAFVKTYLDQRMAWMDTAFATPESFNAMCR